MRIDHALPLAALCAALICGCSREEQARMGVAVYEYTPAPGQFVGESYEPTDAKDAAFWAQQRLEEGRYVSLGAFGGYIVLGACEIRGDERIPVPVRSEFGIKGNASASSSEPGVVWVARDANANGIADDEWIEIQGTAQVACRSYEVTYFRPQTPGDVSWTDNLGGSGTIPWNSYHSQNYYPSWVDADSYTLCGTLLEPLNYDSSGQGTLWINPSYGSGYADNYDPDNQRDGYTIFALPEGVGRVDFVKVQTAVQAVSGWLGEASTEVCGFKVFER